MEMETPNKPFSSVLPLLNIVLAAGGIGGGLLLACGFMHKWGFVSAFGISTETIPVDLGDNLVEAFYLGLILAGEIFVKIKWLILAFGIMLILLPLILLFIARRIRNTDFEAWLKRHGRALSDASDKPYSYSRLIKVMCADLSKPIFWTYLVFAISVTFIAALTKAYSLGNNTGIEQLEEYRDVEFECNRLPEKNLPCTQIIRISDSTVLAEGLWLLGNEKYRAIFDGKDVTVIPDNSDYKLVIFTSSTQITETSSD